MVLSRIVQGLAEEMAAQTIRGMLGAIEEAYAVSWRD